LDLYKVIIRPTLKQIVSLLRT